MLKNMKLVTKISVSFGFILILLMLVAYVGYNGMSGVTFRAEKADEVNQMVKLLLAARQAEIKFMLNSQASDAQQVETHIAELRKQADATRKTFTLQKNQELMDQVTTAVTVYSEAFQTYLTLSRQKASRLSDMEANAGLALRAAGVIRNARQTQLERAIVANTVVVQANMQIAADANALMNAVLEAQAIQIRVMKGDASAVKNWRIVTGRITDLIKGLRAQFTAPQDLQQVDDILTKYRTYADTVQAYFDTLGKLDQAGLEHAAFAALGAMQALRDDYKDQLEKAQALFKSKLYDTLAESGAADTALLDRIISANAALIAAKTALADDANALMNALLKANADHIRVMSGDERAVANWNLVHERITSLITAVRARLTEPQDIQHADDMLTTYQQYAKTTQAYFDTLRTLDAPMLERAAFAAIGAMQALRDDHKDRLEKSQALFKLKLGDRLTDAEDATQIARGFLEARRSEKEFVLSNDPQKAQAVVDAMTVILKLTRDLRARVTNAASLPKLNQTLTAIQAYQDSFTQLVDLTKQQDGAAAKMVNAAQTAEERCQDLGQFQKTQMALQISQANLMMFTGTGIALVFGIAIALLIISGTMNQLGADPAAVADLANRIAAGDFTAIGNTDRKAAKGVVAAMQQMSVRILAVSQETNALIQAVQAGKLETRGNADAFAGGWRELVTGVNNVVNAFLAPFNVTAAYLDRIAKGDLPEPITEAYRGDFNEMKNNLNSVIGRLQDLARAAQAIAQGDMSVQVTKRSEVDIVAEAFQTMGVNIRAVIEELNRLVNATQQGQLDTRGEATKFQGDFARIVQGVNKALDAVIGPLNVAAEYVDRISQGNIPEPITNTYHGDFNELKNNLNQCIVTVNDLISEAQMLTAAAVAGKLSTRGNAAKFQGGFKQIVQGMNDTLDEVIGPLNVAANYVERISKGDIPQPITDAYNGDFNAIKLNLNQCIAAVNGLVIEAGRLTTAAVDGKLATRGDVSRFQGDFAKIVQGVNNTLDAVIGPLNVAARYVDRISKGDIPDKITDDYNGDFNTIKNNLNKCIEAVNGLVAEVGRLATATVDGWLATRGDISRFQGDFAKIVQGVNNTLDAVIWPLNVAANYVDRISKGDIPKPIAVMYNGDFNTIKNNLNQCIAAVNGLVAEAGRLTTAAVEGKLETRGDVHKFQGEFAKIVQGVNNTLDAVIGPLNVAARYVERISKGDIPDKITDEYNGDFNTIKHNLNQCIDAINGLVAEAGRLTAAAVDGKLATRGEVTRFQGDFATIVKGVNETLDAVIGPLKVAGMCVEQMSKGDIPEKITAEYRGDFNEIKQNLNILITAMNDVTHMAQEMAEGNLTVAIKQRSVF